MKQLLYEAGLTQTEFAKQLGTSGTTVSFWLNEKRKPSPKMIIKMSSILKIKPEIICKKLKIKK